MTITLSFAIGNRSKAEVRNEIGDSLREISYIMGDKLDHYMWTRYGEVSMLSELNEIRQTDLEGTRQVFDRMKGTFPSFSWIGLTDANGTVIASTDGLLEGMDISSRPVYLEAQEETFIGDVHEAVLLAELLPNPSGEEIKFVDISTPIFDEEGKFTGVLAAHLSWEWAKEIQDAIMDPLHKRDQLEMYIVSNIDDTVLLGPDDELGKSLHLSSIDHAREGYNDWVLETWPDGKEYLTGYVFADGYKDYPGLEWTVLVRQPVEVAYAPMAGLQQFIYILGFVFAGVLAIIGWMVAGKITDPLKKITKAADLLRQGEKAEIPDHKGIKEIEVLAFSLKKLIDNLTKTESALVEMEDVAHRDHLTGLPNRIALDTYLEHAMNQEKVITVLYLDLDGFKQVNDTLGHETGDKLLVEVGSRLKESIRSEELVARMGGDEFVIVLTSHTDPTGQALKVGERVIPMINQPFLIDGEKVSVGCSIGGAVWNSGIGGVSEVIRRADEALYEVKRTGKNSIKIE
ncbi:diguanylate cyclase [Bacillus tianshenii]|uniref:diguanylate cyclase domain-containing protein n=1 Tax=Sutcliffiella tianshenii TaxID=1463404 RepID=UPI001CD7A7D2|nr:diguanylate cyclase [Bacillus tianshenii]MCA1322395.1 diguanylate cyclase [Bacillus tianshenii]